MSDGYVSVDACHRTREAMYKDLTRIDGVQCNLSDDAMDTKIILAKLTILQEIALKTTSDLATTVKDIDKRVMDRENERFEVESRVPVFWESETGKRLIIGLFMLFSVVLFVALDQNIGLISKLLGKE